MIHEMAALLEKDLKIELDFDYITHIYYIFSAIGNGYCLYVEGESLDDKAYVSLSKNISISKLKYYKEILKEEFKVGMEKELVDRFKHLYYELVFIPTIRNSKLKRIK